MTKWLEEARRLIGTREIVGPKHNPTILAWAKRLGAKVLGITLTDDETPWCALYVSHCIATAGLTPPPISVRASSWAAWGQDLRADRLAPGAVLVFSREGGGHAGFYVGEDAKNYHVLGGNQGNRVSIAPLAKNRCTARRWPVGVPLTGAPVWTTLAGAVSTNEA